LDNIFVAVPRPKTLERQTCTVTLRNQSIQNRSRTFSKLLGEVYVTGKTKDIWFFDNDKQWFRMLCGLYKGQWRRAKDSKCVNGMLYTLLWRIKRKATVVISVKNLNDWWLI